jgi:hypothetical protein
MTSSSDHEDLPAVSSSDSEDHPVAFAGTSDNECTSNNESSSNYDFGDSQTEGDDQIITDLKLTSAKNSYTGRRNPTKRSSGCWSFKNIDLSRA